MALVAKSTQYTSRFSPTSVPGCQLWLDAADSNAFTFSSGSNIASWRDKSGNSNNATGVNSPTRSGSSVVLNGTSQYFTCPSNVTYSPANIFFVATNTGTTAGTVLRKGQSAGVTFEMDIAVLSTTAARFTIVDSTNSVRSITTTVSSTSGMQLYGMTYDNTTLTPYYNGSAFATTTGTGSTTVRSSLLVLGSVPDDSGGIISDYNFKGSFHEILIYNSPPSPSQRQAIEGYLAAKWGLASSLPASHPFKSAQPFTRPFQPVDILGCRLWLDAADSGALVISGTDVTTWRDKSGNGFDFTVPGNFVKPVYTSNAINGLPAISFTGGGAENAQDMMMRNTSFSLNVSAYSMFVVARQNASSPSPYGANYILGAVSGSPLLYGTYTGGNFITSVGSTGSFNDLTVNSPNTQMKSTSVTGMVVNGSVLTPYFNGTAMSTKNGATGSYTGLDIGASGGGQTWQGLICEILVFNSALTTAERQIVENYLATKWGLRGSMPAGHPTRLTPALSPVFFPSQISGCTLWLDAADTSTLSITGSNLNQWNDKSGRGFHFVKRSGFPVPVYQSNGINGYASISFTGAGVQSTTNTQFLENTTISFNTSSYSIFAVANKTGGGTTTGYGYVLKGTVDSDFYLFFGQGSGNIATFTGSTSGWNDINVNSPAISICNVPRVMAMTVSSTVLTPYYDGKSMNTKTGTTSAFSGLRLGETSPDSYSGQNWNGLIGEVLVFSPALGVADRQRVEGYLANKWRLTSNLSGEHPFKVIRP